MEARLRSASPGASGSLLARLRDPAALFTTLQVFEAFNENGVLEVDAYGTRNVAQTGIAAAAAEQPPGLRLQAFDVSRIAYVSAFLPRACFSSYSLAKSDTGCLTFAVRLDALLSALRPHVTARALADVPALLLLLEAGSDVLTLRVERSPASLRPSRLVSEHRIYLMTTSMAGERFDETDAVRYSASLLLESAAVLQDLCLEIKLAAAGAEELLVCLSSDGLRLQAESATGLSRTSIALSAVPRAQLEVEQPVAARFKLKLLALSVAKLAKVSSAALLQLGPDAPLSFRFNLRGGGGGYVHVAFAPVLEDESPAGAPEAPDEGGAAAYT